MLDAFAMETSTLTSAILAVTLAAVTLYAWRLGNEKRDVALLGAFSGLFGVIAVVTVAL